MDVFSMRTRDSDVIRSQPSPLFVERNEMWMCPCGHLDPNWPDERCPKCRNSVIEVLRWLWGVRRETGRDR